MLEFLEITCESLFCVVGLLMIFALIRIIILLFKEYSIFIEKLKCCDKIDLLHYLFDNDSIDLDSKETILRFIAYKDSSSEKNETAD